MSPVKKANFIIIFVVAILAILTSSVAYSFTGNFIDLNDSQWNLSTNKLIAVGDGNFSPLKINTVVIINNNTTNTTNITNNSTLPIDTNSSNI
ncbi:hypothetical protein [Methanobrevibacter curvatus]|uniref:Uncharacterized protein n=1 Tax=Methanobrevibacter curvatus TaxID=49547 RepID=A0A165Z2K3_9EURY|nr:hypothetical protein [Methanobrevibacter curvatus]KZX10171.1 hypothetical protein MBCUR_19060 [Methanobrevibacter curvatus]